MVLVNGGTPTNLAIQKTMAIMQAFNAGDSDKIVFLITDGRMQCLGPNDLNLTDAQALALAVADLQDGLLNHDITTYVVAIAPTMFGPTLQQMQEMAIAGGAPKPGPEAFYRADDAQQLSDALNAVLQDSYGKSCLMDLTEPPFYPDYTKVLIGNTLYTLVNDCNTENGFIYTKMDYSQIQMCGTACDELAIEQSAEVQYFCMPG
jgi:hypothetical protein